MQDTKLGNKTKTRLLKAEFQTVDKVPKGALFFVAKKDEKEVGIWYN